MGNFYDKLGDILRDTLDSEEDPFETWEPHGGKRRSAGNIRERTPPPRTARQPERIPVPDELVEDFRVLALAPGVPLEDCKAAWKSLLKRYHPDRHAGNEKKMNETTAVSIRITDSYRRIERWYETGIID